MAELTSWLTAAAARFGPWGLFVVAFADSSFVPLPQAVDALIIAQAIAAPSTAYQGAALAIAGSLAGSVVLYELARRGGRRIVEKRISPRVMTRVRQQIEKYGVLVLLAPTLIPFPLPMAPVVIAAGLFHMQLSRFIIVIVFGRVVRYFGETYLALRYGDQTIILLRENAVASIASGVALTVLFFIVYRWSHSRLTAD